MIKNYSKQSPLTQLKIMLVLVKATPSKRDLGTPWVPPGSLFLPPPYNKILSDYDLVINKCCDMFPGS